MIHKLIRGLIPVVCGGVAFDAKSGGLGTSPKSGVVGCQQCVMAAAADAKRAIAVIVEKKSYRIYLGTYFYAPAVASLQRQAIVD
ncbi:hypothetical protein PoMZ_08150 [Pyricularia oryzae]|uniref:Uncharacterized protein n=1 Tax=Pyricularia oryzae TaxID=318829 RepID=A0A4P7NGW3_PYROR|nr:hypothetical protein PoMZ_08150 [Pyricularia oryzae]